LAEVGPLSTQENELKTQSNTKIASLLRREELKWYQLSKSQFILEGDSNARYFHSVVNSRHSKKRIHTLIQDECTIEGLDKLKAYITNYYKNRLRASDDGNFSMDESRTDDITQVFDAENNFFTAEYSEDEVRKTIFKWNTTKHRVRMVFQQSFTKPSGRLSKVTF
jgi:hypothetical protein